MADPDVEFLPICDNATPPAITAKAVLTQASKVLSLAKRNRTSGSRRFDPVRFLSVLTYLQYNLLVRPEGFEPPALCSEDRCSNPLSYGRIVDVYYDN